jgi:signal transduction histidine kinase
MESGLALALMESDLCTGTRMKACFVPTDRGIRIDRFIDNTEKGYDVELIDSKPAAERIQELICANVSGVKGRIILGLRTGNEYSIVMPIDSGLQQAVRMNRKLGQGDYLHIMSLGSENPEEILGEIIDDSIKSANETVDNLAFVLGFGCGALRQARLVQGRSLPELGKLLKDRYRGASVAGALCAGEFAMDRWHGGWANHMSVWGRCYFNSLSTRANGRMLQEKLIQASASLITCNSFRDAMKAALKGAIDAGSTGGQICIVDHRLGRILGKELGAALNKEGSKQDWETVARFTDLPVPESKDFRFPAELEDYAIPVMNDSQVEISPWPQTRDEDILALITRTLHAIFIPDSSDARFRCDREAIRKGNIIAQLILPLISSNRKILGIMQLSFPDHTILDRERLGLWVSYAQKTAITLERAQATEARKATQLLAENARLILAEPMDINAPPFKWCESYASEIRNLLDAHSVHIRIRRQGLSENEFFLVASVGEPALQEARKNLRSVIKASERGSCMTEIFQSGGIITRKAQEALPLRVGTDVLKEEEASIRATAWLPIVNSEEPMGSLVIDDKREYFFTEARAAIAHEAAKLIATIQRAKKESYDRAVQEWFRNKWVDQITDKIRKSASHEDYRAAFSAGLQSLGEMIGADWGSLFIWHDMPAKLLLYASWNWNEHLEDKAFYKKNEGWTGRLAGEETGVALVTPYSPQATFVTGKYLAKIEQSWDETENPANIVRIGSRLELDRVMGVIEFGCKSTNSNSRRLVAGWRKDMVLLASRVFASLLKTSLDRFEVALRENLHKTEEETAGLLINKLDPSENWQEILDKVRNGFQVERVSLFLFDSENRSVEHAWSGSAREWHPPQGQIAVVSNSALDKFLLNTAPLLITQPAAPKLEHWPNGEAIDTLFVVSAISAEGKVRGFLEFANRITAPDHPYNFFNEIECQKAQDMARLFGVALAYQDYKEILGKLQSRLETATKIGAAGVFGGMVLHELMGPFERIQLGIDMLREFPERDPSIYYQQIEAQTQRAAQMLLMAANRGVPAKRVESLRALVREAVAVIKATMPLTRISLNVQGNITALVFLDSMTFVTALVNIMSNAVEVMTGQGTLTIKTQISEDGNKAIISIHNTGTHLTDEVMARMFIPGFTTKPGKHMGMGLALARYSIRAMGGEVAALNADKGGVDVIVSLPIYRGEQSGDTI